MKASADHPLLVCLALLPRSLHRPLSEVQARLRRVDPRQMYHPPSTLHITIKPLGFVGTQVKRRDNSKILRCIEDVTLSTRPFDVRIDGLAAFPEAVYAKVAGGAKDIIGLNEALAKSLGDMVIHERYGGQQMIPHVTLAHFMTSNAEDLLLEVDKARRLSIGEFRLDKIVVVKVSLMKYFGPSDTQGGSFERIATLTLRSRR